MSSPTRRRSHARGGASRGMQQLDELVTASGYKPGKNDELTAILSRLHKLEMVTGAATTDVLDALTATETPAPVSAASQILTAEQEAVLRSAGSFIDEMPPVEQRASTRTAQRIVDMIATALTADEAAERLGVTSGRIRQRLGAKTLLGVKVGSAHRLPGFQFTEDGELPGWDRIAPAVPSSVHPVSIARFMHTAHPDLTVVGEALPPTDWLIGGGDPEYVVSMIHTAFVVHAS
ncbi:hypothetical protein L5G28_05855 [Gordonia sp. HY285]|uniref:hypothetical protein n=1 Tax=Gordonia liuliyuniae TaxID=2911517 RepID=UPI001F2D0B6A|nr:hypothetical protein [Gordonia liuliyuniae]MCF8609689.1 hypothetical protein [Gordonia liuliyuniae]